MSLPWGDFFCTTIKYNIIPPSGPTIVSGFPTAGT
jgi:hypothetical protein